MNELLESVVSTNGSWSTMNEERDSMLLEVSRLAESSSKGSELLKTEAGVGVHQKMHWLLRKFYSVSHRRTMIEEIFSTLDLWSSEDLDILAQRMRTGRLRYYVRPLLKALSQAQSGEIANFGTEVRLSRSRSDFRDEWVGYLMLLKYENLRLNDIELLFRTLITKHLNKSFFTGAAYKLSEDHRRFKPEDEEAVRRLTEESFGVIQELIQNQNSDWAIVYERFKSAPNWRGRSFDNNQKREIEKFMKWILATKFALCEAAVE